MHLRVDHLCGTILAEIEAVLKEAGLEVQPRFAKYLLVEIAGIRNNLINIENNHLVLHALCSPKY